MGDEKDSFEVNLKKLEDFVTALEQGDLHLKETLEKFEAGNKLSKLCTAELDAAQQKIEKIMEVDGRIVSEPFENEE